MIPLQTLAACLLSATAAIPPTSQQGFRVYWDEGLRMESGGGAVAITVGGRIQADFGTFAVVFQFLVWSDDPWASRTRKSELNEAIWWALK
jgi:hypothetical protein